MGIPRIRKLRHRVLERTRRQGKILAFLDERVATAPIAFPDQEAVWAALKSDQAVIVAAVSDV